MKEDNSRRRQPGAIFLLLLVSYCVSSAQVTIREKITIDPKRHQPQINRLIGVSSGFVMEKKGFIQLYYGGATRLSTDFPPNAALIVNIRNGDTIVTDLIGPRYTSHSYGPWTYYNSCTGLYETDPTEIYQSPRSPFTGPRVQVGDKVQVFYLTDGNPDTLAYADTTQTPFGWNVDFGRTAGCITWAEKLNVFVGVADTTITFTPSIADTLWPTYRNHNTTLHTRNYIDLQAKVQFGDSATKNHWVKVDSAALVDSGGHSHDGNKPPGKYIVRRLADPTKFDTVASFSRQTDSAGMLHFTFLASEFGGIERIKAKRLSDTTRFDTLRLVTRVDSLIDFGGISSNFWVLTGNSGQTSLGACYHAPIKHYSNHWFYTVKIDSIQKAILFFFKWSGTPDGGGNYLKLGINDMSLKYGGLFDICSNWQPAHISHRLGLGVDIDSSSATPFGGGTPVPLTQDQVAQLTRIMQSFGSKRANEKSIHYEFGRR